MGQTLSLVSLQNAQIFRLLLKISVEGNTQMSITIFLTAHRKIGKHWVSGNGSIGCLAMTIAAFDVSDDELGVLASSAP